MREKATKGLSALLLIAMPLVLAGAAMVWSTTRMLEGISRSVDAQEHARAWEAVNSAFESSRDHLAGMAEDNAHWDDAVIHAGTVPDAEWIDGMWGITTADSNYDAFFLVKPDGTTLSAYVNGVKDRSTAQAFFGQRLAKLLGDLPQDSSVFETKTSLMLAGDSVYSVAAAPLVPNSEAAKPVDGRANIVVFGHRISPDDLAKMSRQFIVDGLNLIPGKNEGAGGSVLLDAWGAPVATATWTDRNPGVAARKQYTVSAFTLLLALIAVMLPVSIAHFRSLRHLASSERKARLDARTDALTGLPNRTHLADALAAAPRAPWSSRALLYIDLDGFKSINDTYDHATGDQLLCAVAVGIQALLKDGAMLARLGGDEFAVLLEGSEIQREAEALAVRIGALVKEPFNIDGRVASVGASIGIALSEANAVEPAELMRQADIAMYDGKTNGRGTFRWYRPDLDGKRQEDAAVAAELRGFIARRHFEVAYQPIVNSGTRLVTGVEALARWPKVSSRHLTPDVFIPIAEEHGLIDELGELIAEIACRDVAQWQELRVSVNVSPVQLNNPNFVSNLSRIVRASGLDLRRLEVEFTESVLIRNTARAKEVIGDLHRLGVSVALDDFGTGFASVGYLRAFSFDKIKLDRSLTQSILTNVQAQKVVQGTVLIASGLSAEIIAEGVETEEEAQLMRLSGCHQLQGYHFGKPQAAEALSTMVPQDESNRLRASA